MSDFIDIPASGQSDSGLRPPASLTSIPVRRRRKSEGASPPPRPDLPRQSSPNASDGPTKQRKETFGKLQPVPTSFEETPAEIVPGTGTRTECHSDVPPGAAATPPEGIITLWESLAGETAIPSLIDLDLGKIAAHWPNSLLLRASGGPRRPSVEVARIFSVDAAHDAVPLPVDTMTIDWMMALAREVTHDGVPVHELDNVSAADPDAEYGVIALPFGSTPDAVDHVLCHLYRYDGPTAQDEAARAQVERPAPSRSGRKLVASIFGKRQTQAS